jgi:hypothetical protein
MTDEQNTPDIEVEETAVDELALLRERAITMGIKISGNIGIEALKKKLSAKMEGTPEDEEEEETVEAVALPTRKQTKMEIEQETRKRIQKEKNVLVRCRIHNLNPSKRDLQGEIITIGNKYLGTIRKFIPFGEQTDNGYHIPKCMYDDLKSRQYQHIRTKNVKGQIQVETRMVPEYNIEIMPNLTKEELADLALQQSAVERLGGKEA